MPLIALSCPNCQTVLDVEDSKEFCFCFNCGTKIMIQDLISGSQPEEPDMVENLIALSKTTIRNESAENIQSTAMRILRVDSNNWYGWFAKGAAEAKMHNCRAMYEYWEKALTGSSQKDFDSISDSIIVFASESIIDDRSQDWAEPPQSFIRIFDSLNNGDCFADKVILYITTQVRGMTQYQGGYLMKSLPDLMSAELKKSGDITPFLKCSKDLKTLVDSLTMKTGRLDSNVEHYIRCHLQPFYFLWKDIDNIYERDLRREIAYWTEHDISVYTKYYDDAVAQTRELNDAGPVSNESIMFRIEKDVKKMVKTYLSMKEETEPSTKDKILGRLKSIGQ